MGIKYNSEDEAAFAAGTKIRRLTHAVTRTDEWKQILDTGVYVLHTIIRSYNFDPFSPAGKEYGIDEEHSFSFATKLGILHEIRKKKISPVDKTYSHPRVGFYRLVDQKQIDEYNSIGSGETIENIFNEISPNEMWNNLNEENSISSNILIYSFNMDVLFDAQAHVIPAPIELVLSRYSNEEMKKVMKTLCERKDVKFLDEKRNEIQNAMNMNNRDCRVRWMISQKDYVRLMSKKIGHELKIHGDTTHDPRLEWDDIRHHVNPLFYSLERYFFGKDKIME